MASIKYEVLKKCPLFQPGAKGPSKNTIEQYKTHAIRAAQWMKKTYGVKRFEDIQAHAETYISAYSQYLQATGKTASTIHTYIAACCMCWDVPMQAITKPVRHAYEATRSRGVKQMDHRRDAQRAVSPALYDFAAAVGLRRHEYLALRKNNIKYDESGYLCVEVMRGKGGKYQLQRILPEHEALVRIYFNGSNEFVFSKEEMSNKLDLHHLRAQAAQEAYHWYTKRLKADPNYRRCLELEIEKRWERYRGTAPKGHECSPSWRWDSSRVRGVYQIRGKNRELAIQNGFPATYDRLAVMAVSVFHLSHWRCDVTINHYLLAK